MADPTVFTYSMPAGIPGAVNRFGNAPTDIEAQVMDPTNPLPAYGLFGQIDATSQDFRKLAAGDTTVYGILVRPYPTQATSASGFSGAVPLGTPAVPPQVVAAIDVLKQGYITVALQANNAGVTTQPVKNGPVYACIQNPPGGGNVGGILGAADGGNTIQITNAYFTGTADANGNVEVAYNI